MPEVRLHDQLPRHRPPGRALPAGQGRSTSPGQCHRDLLCCWAAYRYGPAEIFKGSPGPSSHCYGRGKTTKEEQRPNAVLFIAASLIAAVRLNREEIKPSPIVHSKIADSIRLAEMIQARLRE
jgi:hypothetical protein